MNERSRRLQSELAIARKLWGDVSVSASDCLANLITGYGISVSSGDVQLLEGKWYVTHAGLLRLAHRRRCLGLKTSIQTKMSDSNARRWVFRAIVYKSSRSKGFVGYGDADPSNTSPLMRGAEMRVAETRAVNRALRKAYGIGLCSVEELGYATASSGSNGNTPRHFGSGNGHESSNGQPRLRDQLCLLIRKHNLDPAHVKRYAADFCGTEELRAASRDLVESFVGKLAEEAVKDRAALICKLNSYGHAEVVKS